MSKENNNTSFDIEKRLLSEGYDIIAGVDEVGRGALAGPLVLGLVIYNKSFIENPPDSNYLKIKDSKKLKPKKRIEALNIIKKYSIYYDTVIISNDLIDRLNINSATEYALKLLLEKTAPFPDIVIMDGNFKFNIEIPFYPIIKGDEKSITIASASISAKVTRDNLMSGFDSEFPDYLFSKNKGYGTREHREAISRLGPCILHRRSYQPLKGLLTAQ